MKIQLMDPENENLKPAGARVKIIKTRFCICNDWWCLKSHLVSISRICLLKCFGTQAGIPQSSNRWFRDICVICGIISAYLREAFIDFLNNPTGDGVKLRIRK